MKTAKEILYETATKYSDGFLSGQVKWIVEAMEEYAKENFKKGYEEGYKNAVEIYCILK